VSAAAACQGGAGWACWVRSPEGAARAVGDDRAALWRWASCALYDNRFAPRLRSEGYIPDTRDRVPGRPAPRARRTSSPAARPPGTTSPHPGPRTPPHPTPHSTPRRARAGPRSSPTLSPTRPTAHARALSPRCFSHDSRPQAAPDRIPLDRERRSTSTSRGPVHPRAGSRCAPAIGARLITGDCRPPPPPLGRSACAGPRGAVSPGWWWP
jgi:hypothetical protein